MHPLCQPSTLCVYEPYDWGTLSECLFFFGIYSFHFGGSGGHSCLPIFGGGNAIHSPSQPEKKTAWRACLSPPPPSLPEKNALPTHPHLTPIPTNSPTPNPVCIYPPPESLIADPPPPTMTNQIELLMTLTLKSPFQTNPDAYGHTTGNTPEPVRFQKLSLVRPS